MDVEIKENAANQTAVISSSKYLSKFFISKASTGSIFFKVELETGPTPNQLSGVYSSMRKAIEAVSIFLRTAKETQGAKNERLDKERKERHAVSNAKGI
jgi:hypothetical protein